MLRHPGQISTCEIVNDNNYYYPLSICFRVSMADAVYESLNMENRIANNTVIRVLSFVIVFQTQT